MGKSKTEETNCRPGNENSFAIPALIPPCELICM
jgi:hypothetical protein